MADSPQWPMPNPSGWLGDGRAASDRLRPTDLAALCAAVADRSATGEAIYPQGGGTALDYGGLPARPGVAIEATGLDRVIDYPHADMTITVEAGITLAKLQGVLAERGQFLPLDAPQPERATLGGIWATNTAGPRRYGWGRPRDLILGVGFVNADGHYVKGGGRVVKNVAGYDFPRLLTGSMGTLGVIAQMTLKVRPRPASSALAWIPVHDPVAAAGHLERLGQSQTRPVAIELLNRPAAQAIAAPLDLPIGRDDTAVLVLGFEEGVEGVRWQVEDRLPIELGTTHWVARWDQQAAPLWSALVESTAAEAPLVLSGSVTRSGVMPLVQALDPGRWSVHAHAGSGIVRAGLRQACDESIFEELARLRALAAAHDGAIVLARGPSEWKPRLGVWGEPRGDRALAGRVKNAFDPGHVFNPGRFVA